MTTPDIRFDCRFCNKPVRVPAKRAGQRVKCPGCKNPVVVPGKQDTMSAGFTEAESSKGQLKQVSDRPITRGRGSLGLGKLLMLAGLVAAVIFGWQYFKDQSAKPLNTLLEEYADGNKANGPFIKQKLSDAAAKEAAGGFELGELKKYVTHKDAGVRAFMMECLGLIRYKKAYAPLAKGLEDEDPVVRRTAAIALGSIREKKVIDLLIKRMKAEKKQTVKGGIRQALVALTGQKQFKAQGNEWDTWWDASTRKKFVFPK